MNHPTNWKITNSNQLTCRTRSRRQQYRPRARGGTAQPSPPPVVHPHIHPWIRPHIHPHIHQIPQIHRISQMHPYIHSNIHPDIHPDINHSDLLCLQSKQLEDSLTCANSFHWATSTSELHLSFIILFWQFSIHNCHWATWLSIHLSSYCLRLRPHHDRNGWSLI